MTVGSRLPYSVCVMVNLQQSPRKSQILKSCLTDFNHANYMRKGDLIKGYFNDVSVPFDPIEGTPYELPYDSLIRGMGKEEISGRPVYPAMLNRKGWPKAFFPHGILRPYGTISLHVSLTPVISFKTESQVVEYWRLFERELERMKQDGQFDKRLKVRFEPQFRMLARADYARMFATLGVAKETYAPLAALSSDFTRLRLQLKGGPGSTFQESSEVSTSLQLDAGTLHMTFGYSYVPKNCKNRSRNPGTFDQYCAHYLNEVMLKPKQMLLQKYGAEAERLKRISDVKTGPTPEEAEELEFDIDSICLSLNWGNMLTYRLD